MKKVAILFFVLLFSLSSLTSCLWMVGFKDATYVFYDERENIVKIELALVTEEIYDTEVGQVTDYEFSYLAEVNDIASFMDEFDNLYCYTFNLLPPRGIYEEQYIVIITYESGTSEYIGTYGQVYSTDGVFTTTTMRLYFDEEEYHSFIKNYAAMLNYSYI